MRPRLPPRGDGVSHEARVRVCVVLSGAGVGDERWVKKKEHIFFFAFPFFGDDRLFRRQAGARRYDTTLLLPLLSHTSTPLLARVVIAHGSLTMSTL